MANSFNNYIGIQFNNDKDRIAKTRALEREMDKKYKIHRSKYRISILGDCIVCQYKDNRSYY